MPSILSRWKARRAVRATLLSRARKAFAARKTKANLALVKLRKKQVAAADRVLARHANAAPIVDETHDSPNQSSRRGVTPSIIVLHATEGGFDGAVSWLCNPQAQASAHLVISKAGRIARLVPDAAKAWHVASFNSQALGIEQEGFTAQTAWPEAQLQAVASWVAYWARTYNIPLTHSTTHGVCRHMDLGQAGGGHGDPGDNYPFEHVLELARKS